jgi:hypothetical protein
MCGTTRLSKVKGAKMDQCEHTSVQGKDRKGGGSARPVKLDDEGQAAFNGAQVDL